MKLSRNILLLIGLLLIVSLLLNGYSLMKINKVSSSSLNSDSVRDKDLSDLSKQLNETNIKINKNTDQISKLLESDKMTEQEIHSFQFYESQSNRIDDSISKLTNLIYN